MELKVGMYVRTKKGYIAKILGVDYLLDDNGCELNNIEAVYLDKMVDEIGKDIYAGCVSQVFKECRVRDNPIDLIEVGDYVNGLLVVIIFTNVFNNQQVLVCSQNEKEEDFDYSDDISDYMSDEFIHVYNEIS